MAENYPNCLGTDEYNGKIGDLPVRWSDSAQDHLQKFVDAKGLSIQTLKAMTEHLINDCAVRLDARDAVIKGSAHETTTNSVTEVTEEDDDHITLQLKRNEAPTVVKVHIYLQGHGEGNTAYDNISMIKETVYVKGVLNNDLSIL